MSKGAKKFETINDRWLDYLGENLKFPFEAEFQSQGFSRIPDGTIFKVIDMEYYDDMYGILFTAKNGRVKNVISIYELELLDKKSNNYFILNAYLEWHDNNH